MKWISGLLVLAGLLQAAFGGELRVFSYNIKHGQGMDGEINLERRTALEVQVTVKGSETPVSFVSVHNDWSTEAVRLGQVAALLDGLKKVKHPVILAGDFNGELEDGSMKLLVKEGWTVLDKNGVKTAPSDVPKVEIDFVVTRGLDAKLIEHAAIEERVVSDHWPIFAVWQFSGE